MEEGAPDPDPVPASVQVAPEIGTPWGPKSGQRLLQRQDVSVSPAVPRGPWTLGEERGALEPPPWGGRFRHLGRAEPASPGGPPQHLCPVLATWGYAQSKSCPKDPVLGEPGHSLGEGGRDGAGRGRGRAAEG